MKTHGILDKRPHASRFVRIGQRLVAEALVTPQQLHEAVEAQRRSGSRLGSVLVELGHLDADHLARCLGRWYGMPAALQEHFAQRDPSLQARLSPGLAAQFGAVPLNWLDGSRRWIALAVMDPLPQPAIEQIAAAMGHALVPVIAADYLVRQCLKRIYGVAPMGRAAEDRMAPPLEHLEDDPECELELRLARTAGSRKAAPAPRAPDDQKADEETPEIDQEIEIDFDEDLSEDTSSGVSDDSDDSDEITVRRRRLEDAGDAADAGAIPLEYSEADSSRLTNPIALGRIPLRRRSASSPIEPGTVSTFVAAQTLEDVLRALRRATSRERIGELTLGALRDHFEQVFDMAALLSLRDLFAVGWKGFVRHGRDESVQSLTLPVRAASIVADAHASRRPYVGAPPGGGSLMDQRMWRILDVEPPSLVAVAPLLVDTSVGCIVYAHTHVAHGQAADVIGDQFTALAGAAAAALERLARDSDR
jgi:Type II secretion system (T2SS), protein E, N-terminal domain